MFLKIAKAIKAPMIVAKTANIVPPLDWTELIRPEPRDEEEPPVEGEADDGAALRILSSVSCTASSTPWSNSDRRNSGLTVTWVCDQKQAIGRSQRKRAPDPRGRCPSTIGRTSVISPSVRLSSRPRPR